MRDGADTRGDFAHDEPLEARLARWTKRYGSTGVKVWTLGLGDNDGRSVYFHELSLADLSAVERVTAAENESLEDTGAGLFDVDRFAVALALIEPKLHELPDPNLAVIELAPAVRQWGHGPLDEDDLGADRTFAETQITDLRNARASAYAVHANPSHTDLYVMLAQRLASGPSGVIDPAAFYTLIQMTPGQIRDLGAHLEQVHVVLRQEERASAQSMDAERREQVEAFSKTIRFNPFDLIDAASGGISRPDLTDPVDDASALEQSTRPLDTDDYVPGSRPARADTERVGTPRPQNHEVFDNLTEAIHPKQSLPEQETKPLIDMLREGDLDIDTPFDDVPSTRRRG